VIKIFGGCNVLSPTIHVTQFDIVGDVGMQQPPFGSNVFLPLVSQGGLELKENICVDGQWWIEHCPPIFVVQCSAFQKTTIQMQSKYQPLQIRKWNYCSMLFKVLGIIL
jgi:hypothetical protein